MRVRICDVDDCGKPHYGRGWCVAHYTRWRRRGTTEPAPLSARPRPQCSVDGCETEVGVKAARGLCVSHYSRWQRWGEVKEERPLRAYRVGSLSPDGYWIVAVPGHPVARKNGQAFEHRVVAYAKYGPGAQMCHWCGVSLTWESLDVDHVDGIRLNNEPSNLVTACRPCNRQRAARGNPTDFKPEAMAR